MATHILVREVYEMLADGFHETRIPPPSDGEGVVERLPPYAQSPDTLSQVVISLFTLLNCMIIIKL